MTIKKKKPLFSILTTYASLITERTGVPVYIAPSEVESEAFHVTLFLLSHQVIVGNSRARFRVRLTSSANIPPSEEGIEDALEKSLLLEAFFSEAESFGMGEADDEGVRGSPYVLVFTQKVRDDDELFVDLGEEGGSYAFRQSWIIETEFCLGDFFEEE